MLRTTFALGALLTVLSSFLAATPEAYACACCDGTSRIRPLRWTEDGSRVLVRVDDSTACEHHSYVKLLDRQGGERCVDLNGGDPRTEISCGGGIDSLATDKPGNVHAPEATALWAATVAPATALGAKNRRIKVRKVRPEEVEGGGIDDIYLRHVAVDVRTKGRWTRLWEGVVAAVPSCPSADDGPCTRHNVAVAVYPSPDGRSALVTVEYHDSIQFGTALHWVDLPAGR